MNSDLEHPLGENTQIFATALIGRREFKQCKNLGVDTNVKTVWFRENLVGYFDGNVIMEISVLCNKNVR